MHRKSRKWTVGLYVLHGCWMAQFIKGYPFLFNVSIILDVDA